MLGKDIVIDREKCDGCGLCVQACHEGALAIVDGKAALVRKDFCDGLGDCLPACPRGAISFAERRSSNTDCGSGFDSGYQWPIQLALVPPRWDFYRGTIVIAADCTAFVMDRFRSVMAKGDPVIIGCPKLDDHDRFDKVLAILRDNPVDEVRVIRMEVPCCRALTNIVRAAAEQCGRDVRVTETIVSRGGSVLSAEPAQAPAGFVGLRRSLPLHSEVQDPGLPGDRPRVHSDGVQER